MIYIRAMNPRFLLLLELRGSPAWADFTGKVVAVADGDTITVLRDHERVSGYSRQQLTRLLKRGGERAALTKLYRGSRTSFVCTYTSADVILLAATDTLHGTLSGLATKKLMERAYRVFADARYERLAVISVAHLYNLRKHSGYQRHRRAWTKTRPVTIAIGERTSAGAEQPARIPARG